MDPTSDSDFATGDFATGDFATRAAAAESAVLHRHLRRIAGIPGTGLGIVSWPAAAGHRLTLRWHYWWQAHLLDCAVDAALRNPDTAHRRRIAILVRSIRLRNLGRFTNDYYDDMAWIGLALQRAAAVGSGRPADVRRIVTRILDAWSPSVGGIPWRAGDDYYNAPANGPAAILLARNGFGFQARRLADWMDASLRVPGSDLIADGFHPGNVPLPVYYTYCQGVVLGAELELAQAGGDRMRVHRLVDAVDRELATAGVLSGHGGGNEGLFTGILVRYLALVATSLPGKTPADQQARATAGRLVRNSAEFAWRNRIDVAGGPLFGVDWSTGATMPRPGRAPATRDADVEPSVQAERDLSVQLSGWMLMEAAAMLQRTAALTAD